VSIPCWGCRQFRIVDQWRRLIDGLDESPLPFGQYQAQRIQKWVTNGSSGTQCTGVFDQSKRTLRRCVG
jgi:hypothetical protein